MPGYASHGEYVPWCIYPGMPPMVGILGVYIPGYASHGGYVTPCICPGMPPMVGVYLLVYARVCLPVYVPGYMPPYVYHPIPLRVYHPTTAVYSMLGASLSGVWEESPGLS